MNYPYPSDYNLYQSETPPEEREDLPTFAEYMVNVSGNGKERPLCLDHAIGAIHAAVRGVNGWTRDEIHSQLVVVGDEGNIEGVGYSYDPPFSQACEECRKSQRKGIWHILMRLTKFIPGRSM